VSVLVTILAVALPLVRASAQAPSTVWSRYDIVSDEPTVDNDDKSNTICVRGDAKKRQVPRSRLTYNPDGSVKFNPLDELASAAENRCLVQNAQGLFAGDWWAPHGRADHMTSLAPATTAFDAAPASNVVLVRTAISGGYWLSVNYSLKGIGMLTANTATTADLQWRLVNYADSLRYSNGQAVVFRSHAFSANGRFLVAHLAGSNYLG
jgi:hypothetical protein